MITFEEDSFRDRAPVWAILDNGEPVGEFTLDGCYRISIYARPYVEGSADTIEGARNIARDMVGDAK